MAKNKQLNLSTLKRLDAEFNRTIEITLSNSYTLQIDQHFRNSVIEEVFQDLINFQNIINQNKEDEMLSNFPLEKYSIFLLILNFTSLKNIKPKSISEQIQIMNMLIDQNLFKEILDKMEEHCGEEIKKFNAKIFEIMQERLESMKAQEQFMTVFNEEIEKGKLKKDITDELVEVNEEGDENLESPATVEADRSEVKE